MISKHAPIRGFLSYKKKKKKETENNVSLLVHAISLPSIYQSKKLEIWYMNACSHSFKKKLYINSDDTNVEFISWIQN